MKNSSVTSLLSGLALIVGVACVHVQQGKEKTNNETNDADSDISGTHNVDMSANEKKMIAIKPWEMDGPFGYIFDESQLVKIFEEEPNETEFPFEKKMHSFYKSCTNLYITEYKFLVYLSDAIKDMGGWPGLESNQTTNSTIEWLDRLALLRKNGFNHEIFTQLRVFFQPGNDTFRSIRVAKAKLGGLFGHIGLDYEFQDEMKLEREQYSNQTRNQFNSTVDYLSRVLGVEQEIIRAQMEQGLEFEERLYKLSRDLPSPLEQKMGIGWTIMRKFPSEIDWRDYLNKLLTWSNETRSRPFDPDKDTVLIKDDYIPELSRMLKDTDPKMINNYIMFQVVSEIMDLRKSMSSKPEPEHCLQMIKLHMAPPLMKKCLRHYYIDNEICQSSKNLKRDIIMLVKQADWMDDGTKNKSLAKAYSMLAHTGHSDELLKADSMIEEIYQGLEVGDDFIRNMLYLGRWMMDIDYNVPEHYEDELREKLTVAYNDYMVSMCKHVPVLMSAGFRPRWPL